MSLLEEASLAEAKARLFRRKAYLEKEGFEVEMDDDELGLEINDEHAILVSDMEGFTCIEPEPAAHSSCDNVDLEFDG